MDDVNGSDSRYTIILHYAYLGSLGDVTRNRINPLCCNTVRGGCHDTHHNETHHKCIICDTTCVVMLSIVIPSLDGVTTKRIYPVSCHITQDGCNNTQHRGLICNT